jgi:hypothetical protein
MIRMDGCSTCEVTLLSVQGPPVWWTSPTVFRLQEDLVDTEEEARSP